MARQGKAETINFEEKDVYDTLMEMTKGRGPDRCIDAVGAEAHAGGSIDAMVDKAKASVGLATDRPHALREAIMCCRKGGTVSIPGVYIGFPDKIPMGAAMNKALTFKMGQTHVQRYTEPLLEKIVDRRDRPLVRDHARGAPGEGPRDVQDVPRQEGQLHQGGPQALRALSRGRAGAVRCCPRGLEVSPTGDGYREEE